VVGPFSHAVNRFPYSIFNQRLRNAASIPIPVHPLIESHESVILRLTRSNIFFSCQHSSTIHAVPLSFSQYLATSTHFILASNSGWNDNCHKRLFYTSFAKPQSLKYFWEFRPLWLLLLEPVIRNQFTPTFLIIRITYASTDNRVHRCPTVSHGLYQQIWIKLPSDDDIAEFEPGPVFLREIVGETIANKSDSKPLEWWSFYAFHNCLNIRLIWGLIVTFFSSIRNRGEKIVCSQDNIRLHPFPPPQPFINQLNLVNQTLPNFARISSSQGEIEVTLDLIRL